MQLDDGNEPYLLNSYMQNLRYSTYSTVEMETLLAVIRKLHVGSANFLLVTMTFFLV